MGNGLNYILKLMNRFAQKQALYITDSAAARIKQLIGMKANAQDIYGVRLSVRRRGCNGYSYVMNYAESSHREKLDELVEEKGVRVIVESKALMFLVGTEMDYLDNDIKSE